MTPDEFWKIKRLLLVYPFFSESSQALDSWWETMRNYDFELINTAMHRYIQENRNTPTPADILGYIPAAPRQPKFTPKFETVNGRKIRVVQCRRCNDSGLLVWTGTDGNDYSRPCDCPAGHEKYTWGWLTREEQEKYVRERGFDPASIGECWYRDTGQGQT